MNARKRLRVGVESFLYHYPMFANIVLKWELVEVHDRPTMATNGRQLLYNPDFVLENTNEENAWVILHEAGHCFLGHHIRLVGAVLGIANIAFDLALNELIRAACPTERLRKMMVFIGKGDYVDFPPGKDAETYYRRMTQPESPEQDQGAPESSDRNPDTQSESGSSPNEPGANGREPGDESDVQSGKEQAGEAGQGESDGNGPPSDSEGGPGDKSQSADKNGSGGQPGRSKGQPKPGSDMPGSDYRGLGEVLPMPDVNTPEEKAKAEGEWQDVVAESMALGQMCGDCPGWFKALGEKLLGKSEIPWTQVLRQFLTKVVPKGASFSRPNRRSSWRRDVILPCRRSKGGSDGLLIADVSGSLFDRINQAVLPEIEKILISMPKTTVVMMQTDTEVKAEKRFTRSDFPLRMPVEWKGGGGTNLNPAFVKAAKERHKYKWVIIVTDMIWPWQSAPDPKLPCLWIVVGRGDFKEKLKFGRLVAVKD